MKNIYQIIIAIVLLQGAFTSCSLEEWNPATTDLETAYKYKDGYESLINYCYDGLYYFYGKTDGIGAMEMGTDSWANIGTGETGFILYDSKLNSDLGTLRTIWQGFYSTINYCNTAIHYAQTVEGYTDAERNAKVAEAYFLRGWSNWHLVEQFGGVVLRTQPSTITGPDNTPVRSSEEAFYDLILSDLQFACDNLPLSQGAERGRVSKKAAYAMLAKAALQRTRLGDPDKKYAKMALDAAQELINNQSKYGIALYTSDANQSGFAKLWSGANNKNNSEFLFLEAIDHVDGKNPESFNRGRTRQYYVTDCRTIGAVWGTQESDPWLSRANTRTFKPTKYLLTSLFPPVKNPADTRFAETFFYEYYSTKVVKITSDMVNTYGKNSNLINHEIPNTNGTVQSYARGGKTQTVMGQTNMVDNNGDGYLDGLSILTPNWTMSATDKRDLPFWIVDPTDMFDLSGKWITVETNPAMGTYFKEIYPSLKKFSCLEYVDDRQQWLGDIPIIRLGEVYLIAAEAALLYNNDKATALKYVNDIRNRASVTGRQNEIAATESEISLDYILAERGRELCGEQVRWYDLKRMGKLTTQYLTSTNPDILFFNESKHQVRPIPQSYMDAISNPDEFGSNGY
ncbi:membrane protein [Bacteroidia bacterium]|nr:membrane protein [Bacteroidia bacterium]